MLSICVVFPLSCDIVTTPSFTSLTRVSFSSGNVFVMALLKLFAVKSHIWSLSQAVSVDICAEGSPHVPTTLIWDLPFTADTWWHDANCGRPALPGKSPPTGSREGALCAWQQPSGVESPLWSWFKRYKLSPFLPNFHWFSWMGFPPHTLVVCPEGCFQRL